MAALPDSYSVRIVPTNTPSEMVQMDFAGMPIHIPSATIAQLLIDKLQRTASDTPAPVNAPPAIGEQWPALGGIYAGVARGRDGAPDYHLIVLDEHNGETSRKEAMSWGQQFEDQRDPIAGLPLRSEQALMFANVPELFQKTWYWSREQYAGHAGYAWYQLFGTGNQGYSGKSAELRARAVRRFPIR